jgi:hypothetical protein
LCWDFYLLVLCKQEHNRLQWTLSYSSKCCHTLFWSWEHPFYHLMLCVCQYNKVITMRYSKYILDTSTVPPQNLCGYPWTLITKVYWYIWLNDKNTYWKLNITEGRIRQFLIRESALHLFYMVRFIKQNHVACS